MADDSTQLPIAGYGTIQLQMDSKHICLAALYVPNMKTRLYSISQHIQYTGCAFVAQNNAAYLTFPNFVINVENTDEFKIGVQATNNATAHFDEKTAELDQNSPNQQQFTLATPSEYISTPEDWCQDYVRFKKLIPAATIPTRASEQAAGLDISSIENATLAPGETKCIKTGLACKYSQGMYLRIAPRSGNSLKGIIVNGGVIDQDYRGEIGVILHNTSNSNFTIHPNQRIAQGIFEKLGQPQVYVTDHLSNTVQNNKGFGSTNNLTSNKRVQLCHFTETDIFQIDRTRGPGKIRARRLPPTSILRNPLMIPPHPITKETNPQDPTIATTPLVHHPPKPPQTVHHDDDTASTASTTASDNPSVDTQAQPNAPANLPPDDIDLSDWMSPTDNPEPNSVPPDDDDTIQEMYKDFESDIFMEDKHRISTSVQRTSPLPTDPVHTNIDPYATILQPTDSEPTPTNVQELPRVPIEDRPNSALPKRLNITKERLLQ